MGRAHLLTTGPPHLATTGPVHLGPDAPCGTATAIWPAAPPPGDDWKPAAPVGGGPVTGGRPMSDGGPAVGGRPMSGGRPVTGGVPMAVVRRAAGTYRTTQAGRRRATRIRPALVTPSRTPPWRGRTRDEPGCRPSVGFLDRQYGGHRRHDLAGVEGRDTDTGGVSALAGDLAYCHAHHHPC